MLLAVAVVGVLACSCLVRVGQTWRHRLLQATWVVALGLGPAVVLFGWFYVRNIVVYGDIGASDALLELFGRRERGSVPEILTSGHLWVDIYHALLSPSTLARIWPRLLTVITWVAGRRAGGRGGHRTHR